MKFEDLAVFRESKFSVGVEKDSGKYYLSIPVSNGVVDYEEFYEITKDEFELYSKDPSNASEFVRRCRNRENDSRLIMKPGRSRGVPM